MNDQSLNDPQLLSLEARLAAMTPHLTAGEQQQMLYECAFAAGKKSAGGALLRWRMVAAALVILGFCILFPLARNHMPLAGQSANPVVPQKEPAVETSPPALAIDTPAPIERKRAAVELDAWQLNRPAGGPPTGDVALWQPADSGIHSLTVGTLTRAAFQP